jgi:hypothetical protein
LCHNALSVPRTNVSSRPEPQDDTLGALMSVPPRLSQPNQVMPPFLSPGVVCRHVQIRYRSS